MGRPLGKTPLARFGVGPAGKANPLSVGVVWMPDLNLGGQQEWWQAVLDLLPFPALLIEPGMGRIVFANSAAARLPKAALESCTIDSPASLAVNDAGEPLPPDQLPHRRAARGE